MHQRLTATNTQSELDSIVAAVRAESGVPGLALCITHGGERYFSSAGTATISGDEPITPAARFDVSCLMKFFLSVTALKLEAQGCIDIGTDIASHLPELGASRGIRLVHLMSHASGYNGVDITDMAVRWGSKWDTFAAKFCQTAQFFPPGSIFNYEHTEHVILGEVLRRTFGHSPSALVDANCLGPAGVRLTDAAAGPAGISSHAYSPSSSGYIPVNLPPFGPFWAASLPAKTVTLGDVAAAVGLALEDKAIAVRLRSPLISLPSMAISEPRAESPPRQFSAACGLYENGLFGHNGSMFGQTMGFRSDPRTGAVAVAGVNSYSAFARDAVLRRALGFFAGEMKASSSPPAGALRWSSEDLLGPLSFDAVEGRYAGSYLGELTVTRAGTGLRVTVGSPGKRQVGFEIAAENNFLEIKSRMPVALRFQQAPDGEPVIVLGVHAYKRQP